MGKICVCGAPSSGKKCDYCGKRIGKDKGYHHTETSYTINETSADGQQQYDPSTATLNHSGSAMLKKSKIYILISVYIVGIVILPILLMPVVVIIRGYTLEYFQEEGLYNMLPLINFMAYGILCGVMILLTYKIFKQDFLRVDSWGNLFKQMGLGVVCTFGAALLGSSIVGWLGTTDVALNQELVVSALSAMPVAMIITVVLFAPIVEEIIFRLVLMNLFNLPPIFNVILSSLIFGLIHVLAGGLIHIIPYFLMGLVFGYFYLKNDNIWHVTILHTIHNGLTVVFVFLMQRMYYV